MRPQRRLQLAQRAVSHRRFLVCVCACVMFLMILLIGSFTSPSTPGVEAHLRGGIGGDATGADPLLVSTLKPIMVKKTHVALPLFPTNDQLSQWKAAASLPDSAVWEYPVDKMKVTFTDSVLVTRSANKELAMAFPRIPFRSRTADDIAHTGGSAAKKWEGLTMPSDHFVVPQWATVDESNVLKDASIFVSLASYRDPECGDTLRSLFEDAMSPHRIYVGISEERKDSDSDCLRLLDGPAEADVGRVLWGPKAAQPAVYRNQIFWKRDMHWKDIVARPTNTSMTIVTTDDAVEAHKDGQLNATTIPGSIVLLPRYEDEVMTCVGGLHERARDLFVLEKAGGERRGADRFPLMRHGKGGVQQSPSPALAGCRVIRRLAPPTAARGPTFGRYVTSLFYMNQDYFMVVDSHSRFSVDWDAKMIRRIFQNPTPGVLSHYPNGYTPDKPKAEFGKKDVMTMCRGQVLANAMPKLGAMWMPVRPYNVLQAFAAAGYMFGDAQYALDVPFDPFLPYLFDGEEILYTTRLWTTGWDIYGPGEPNIFHHYGRPNSPKFSENVRAAQNALREQSERRALYLLRRSQPWVQMLENAEKHYNLTRAQKEGTSMAPFTAPPYVPGEQRPVVTEEEAQSNPALSVFSEYYGMGPKRTTTAFWQYCQMDDDKVVKRDSEGRWMSGEALCEDAMKTRR